MVSIELPVICYPCSMRISTATNSITLAPLHLCIARNLNIVKRGHITRVKQRCTVLLGAIVCPSVKRQALIQTSPAPTPTVLGYGFMYGGIVIYKNPWSAAARMSGIHHTQCDVWNSPMPTANPKHRPGNMAAPV